MGVILAAGLLYLYGIPKDFGKSLLLLTDSARRTLSQDMPALYINEPADRLSVVTWFLRRKS